MTDALDDPFAKYAQPAAATQPATPGGDDLDDPFAQFVIRRPDDPKSAARKPAPTSTPAAGPPVNTAADIAKSAGIGLAKGGIGVVALPGALESLARRGLNWMSPGSVSDKTVLKTPQDVQDILEKYTGPFYHPQTTAGKYAETIGEFAPVAAGGGGGFGARALNVLFPAVTSETAGELTEGTPYETIARLAGGLVGGHVPTIGGRIISPIPQNPALRDAVANMDANGIPLTAGQRTGNRIVRGLEDAANYVPGAGHRAARMQDRAAEAFTRAALQRAGVNADRATPQVMDRAFADLGQRFDDLSQRTMLQPDQRLVNDVGNTLQRYQRATAVGTEIPIVGEVAQNIQNLRASGQPMAGADYLHWRSEIERVRRDMQGSNRVAANALSDLRDHLDNAMMRSSTPADAAAWRQAREHYRNLVPIETAMTGAGETTAQGLISPARLRTAVQKQAGRAQSRGHSDLGNLARDSEATRALLKTSGTAERTAMLKYFDMAGLLATAGTAVMNPAVGMMAAIPPLTARAFMSRPVQRWLANQHAVPMTEAWDVVRAPGAFRGAASASSADEHSLRGGMGPRYDDNGNLREGAFQ
jgi:hypothetical protein